MKPAIVIYTALIEHLRMRARELGYAIAVHGSLARDIDLVAIPWTEDAAAPEVLAEAVREQASMSWGTKVYPKADDPQVRPHGRLSWAFVFAHGNDYIDLSVMPRAVERAGDSCRVDSLRGAADDR